MIAMSLHLILAPSGTGSFCNTLMGALAAHLCATHPSSHDLRSEEKGKNLQKSVI
jgi:hypothetical protein